tara:strand:+ start:935 stop:1246 length:312 start_codon:yes stop_codon:yes gene_type:complete
MKGEPNHDTGKTQCVVKDCDNHFANNWKVFHPQMVKVVDNAYIHTHLKDDDVIMIAKQHCKAHCDPQTMKVFWYNAMRKHEVKLKELGIWTDKTTLRMKELGV